MVDTIIAQATPSGESALAVLRLSGPLCSEILKSSCGVKNIVPRRANLADYLDLNGSKLDQILITFLIKAIRTQARTYLRYLAMEIL